MNRRMTIPRILPLVSVLVIGTLALSCGGGGRRGNGMMGGGLTPSFTGTANAGPGLSMSTGTVTADMYQVRINVIDVDDFFGAAFFVTFDPAFSSFVSASGTGSFIGAGGVLTRFEAVMVAPGVLDVNAERVGATLVGVDAVGAQPLITLTFMATAETAGSAFSFTPTSPREVQSCTVGGCVPVNEATLTYTGGMVSVVSN